MSQLTPEQISLGLSSHRNRHLFSDHYLGHVLRSDGTLPAAQADAQALLAWLTELYETVQPQTGNHSEQQLEDHWFRPILERLGHVYERQAKVPGLGGGVKFPDFVFFPTDAARAAALQHQQTPDYVRDALAVGEVKRWGIPLGKRQGGAPTFDNGNPSFQIDYYLKATGLRWGILSNGARWRLVHRESSYKLDVYFEIDLQQAVIDGNMAAVAYFWLFFRQAALRPDGDGRSFLDRVLEGSATYALALENDLRDNAYRALEHLIQGFIEPPANGLSADDLPDIYTNSLYLLYRIIFLFYGESRGLLPMENPEYSERSLTRLARDIAGRVDADRKAPPMTSGVWHRLHELFQIIAGTRPDLNAYLGVPRYNGGLFNPDVHPWLERHFVGDRYLEAAIDVLARREVGDRKAAMRRENVDYRTLNERQLGSIYEGLLEYRPQRATEPMAAVKQTKGEAWVPQRTVRGRMKVTDTRNAGDVYLVTDKGERKATGSYYTPDYIVKYIVEQTLGPLVEQARERVKTTGKGAAHGQTLAQEILKLNVLDPAMGSGHFLVEATDFLARAIAGDQYVSVDDPRAADEDDLVYWRRQVVEACIYGVDKNPMAVELAKLSLWLKTVARDRPLSFLDHHLQHGDSLVGARLADLNALPAKGGSRTAAAEQPMLLNETQLVQNTSQAVGGMMVIEGMLSDSIEDIHAKEATLAGVRGHLDRWQQIADLWTSSFFGNGMAPEEYGDLLRHLQGQPSALSAEQRARFLEHPAVTDNDYFHWELAFPEVFFDRHGQSLGDAAGFDAVIGNPPYGKPDEVSKPFHKAANSDVLKRLPDVFLFFLNSSMSLCRSHSSGFGFIIPQVFLFQSEYALIRRLMLERGWLKAVDLGENVFDDAVVPVSIVLGNSSYRTGVLQIAELRHRPFHLAEITSGDFYAFPISILMSDEFSTIPTTHFDLVRLLARLSVRFKPVGLHFNVVQAVQTGGDKSFVISQSEAASKHLERDYLRPVIFGSDIARYQIDDRQLVLLYVTRDVQPEDIPNIIKHLQENYEELSRVSEVRKGIRPFYTLHRPRNSEIFEQKKILIRQTGDSIIATLDESGFFCIDSILCMYSIGVDELDLTATLTIMNSRLMSALYSAKVQESGRVFPQVKPQNIRSLPLAALGIRENTQRLKTFSNEMLRLNQELLESINDFKLDLEGVTDEMARPKLLVQGKWEQSLAQAGVSTQFVNPDSRSTRTLDESLGWDEEAFKIFVKLLVKKVPNLSDLVKVYRKHAPRYRELSARIAATDRLIDQIVYQLYGLTDEEIAIVEAG